MICYVTPAGKVYWFGLWMPWDPIKWVFHIFTDYKYAFRGLDVDLGEDFYAGTNVTIDDINRILEPKPYVWHHDGNQFYLNYFENTL